MTCTVDLAPLVPSATHLDNGPELLERTNIDCSDLAGSNEVNHGEVWHRLLVHTRTSERDEEARFTTTCEYTPHVMLANTRPT